MRIFRPPSAEAVALIWPPCASTRVRQIARPRPEPPKARLRDGSARKKRSNRRGRAAAASPPKNAMLKKSNKVSGPPIS